MTKKIRITRAKIKSATKEEKDFYLAVKEGENIWLKLLLLNKNIEDYDVFIVSLGSFEANLRLSLKK